MLQLTKKRESSKSPWEQLELSTKKEIRNILKGASHSKHTLKTSVWWAELTKEQGSQSHGPKTARISLSNMDRETCTLMQYTDF